jgi:hypothetical protein
MCDCFQNIEILNMDIDLSSSTPSYPNTYNIAVVLSDNAPSTWHTFLQTAYYETTPIDKAGVSSSGDIIVLRCRLDQVESFIPWIRISIDKANRLFQLHCLKLSAKQPHV